MFKIKRHPDGSIQHYESRLAAKGYAQHQGIDYDGKFSPVARFETVRILLSLSSKLSWPIYHFDVKFAFLNGELEEEVKVSQPKGFGFSGNEGKVYKLKKDLYGLKQVPQAWCNKMTRTS